MNNNFAQIIDGRVENIVVVPEEEAHRGAEYLSSDLGLPGTWVTSILGDDNYASIGCFFDEAGQRYSPPQPYASWIFSTEAFDWVPPVPQPVGLYYWNEDEVQWSPLPSPYPSWIWKDGFWNPPVAYPEDGNMYNWDEESASWIPETVSNVS